jgi:phosphoribosylamine--glycine ligase
VNVLLIGSGAREHTIAWKLRQSPLLTRIFVAPGNSGIAKDAAIQPLSIPDPSTTTPRQINAFLRSAVDLAQGVKANLVVIGPEAPLAYGLADRLREKAIPVFGPSKAAAEIEWSKSYGKQVAALAGSGCFADCSIFDNSAEAIAFVDEKPWSGFALKKDGLTSGKGVLVTNSKAHAINHIRTLETEGYFTGNHQIIIEERLTGREVSGHTFTDGDTTVHLPFSCDYKTLLDGDEGPNTGGIGAYAPAVWFDQARAELTQEMVTHRVLKKLWEMNRPFQGVFYPGLIDTDQGTMLLELNARLGDPEAQVLLPLLETDLLEIMLAVANRELHNVKVKWSKKATVAVVLASEGYPEKPKTGRVITGIEDIDSDILVFHAGTKLNGPGQLVTAGGRVLTLVATGKTIEEARKRVYLNVERVHFRGMHYRTDIGVL